MSTPARFAAVVLRGIDREFPYQPAHVMTNPRDLQRPRELHPAFYGCYDWHSSVHGHWLLAHLLRGNPASRDAPAIRRVLNRHLTGANLQIEADYLRKHPGFERPYGWAWLLKLAQELRAWDEGRKWLAALEPACGVLEARYLDWLPKQTYPIRAGTHANTAFGLSFALDYAIAFQRDSLKKEILRKSIAFYAKDGKYPAEWEPGGNDFFSPCLVEADLMRRVYAPDEFAKWFAKFLPQLPPSLRKPATVSDRDDGQLAHLDGLNLSRAWCLFNLAGALPAKKAVLVKAGKDHLQAGLKHIESGSYAGEHWLATFGAYALSAARALEAGDSARAARRT
jgi:hypothetical protein